jgi:hypothetical protein
VLRVYLFSLDIQTKNFVVLRMILTIRANNADGALNTGGDLVIRAGNASLIKRKILYCA